MGLHRVARRCRAVEQGLRGHEGLRAWWREWREAWVAYEDHLVEVVDADKYVVAEVTSKGRGRASGAELEWTQHGAWTIRGGKIRRVVWVRTRAEALEAVGLPDQP